MQCSMKTDQLDTHKHMLNECTDKDHNGQNVTYVDNGKSCPKMSACSKFKPHTCPGVRQIRGTISPVVDITSGVKVGSTRHIRT